MTRMKVPSPTSRLGRVYDARELSEDDSHDLPDACQANALALIGEADLLAEHEHHARAGALVSSCSHTEGLECDRRERHPLNR